MWLYIKVFTFKKEGRIVCMLKLSFPFFSLDICNIWKAIANYLLVNKWSDEKLKKNANQHFYRTYNMLVTLKLSSYNKKWAQSTFH